MLKHIANCCKPLVFVMLIKIRMTCVTLLNYSFSTKNYQFLSQRKPHFYDSIRNEIRTSKYEYYYLCLFAIFNE